MNRPIVVELSHDEALVLHHWLATSALDEALPMPSEADRHALWALEARLDKLLVELFAPDYDELLAAARDRLAKR